MVTIDTLYILQTIVWGLSLSIKRNIKTVREAEEALSLLAHRKFNQQLAVIHQTARAMAQERAGTPGRDLAVQAVLIGFADNIEQIGEAA